MPKLNWNFITLGTTFFLDSTTERHDVLPPRLIWTLSSHILVACFAVWLFASGIEKQSTQPLVRLFLLTLIYSSYCYHRRCCARSEQVLNKLQHVQESHDLHLKTIETLAMAIDAKDQTTQGHVRRTQIYALELGKLIGVRVSELEALRAGALLHDIGKLAVPEYILNKPGKLTNAEYEKTKVHTVVGSDLIKRINFPYPVEDVVRFHHEKWDGSGYPLGLKEKAIPLVARIISIVDFYDTTRCDRPSRVGMKRDDSLSLLRDMSGISFDPQLVEMFVENIDAFDSLISEHDFREQVHSIFQVEILSTRFDLVQTDGVPVNLIQHSGFCTISEAQREVFALHEIAQAFGATLNLQDTAALFTSRLQAIIPFDTCVIYLVDEKSGKLLPAYVSGEHSQYFSGRSTPVDEGVTGWVFANARSMQSISMELDLKNAPAEMADQVKGILSAPLSREEGTFGVVTLYSNTVASYTTEHVRLLEYVALHASNALHNALIYKKSKDNALIDPLTELPNSRALHLMLEQRVAESRRLKRAPFSILHLDIDNFKEVNELNGHAGGDHLLASVAQVIKSQLRQMDMLSRFIGDEFVALMPTASVEVAELIAERIRNKIQSYKFDLRTGQSLQVNISCGVASFPSDGETCDELLNAAERRMQRDKHLRNLSAHPGNPCQVVSIDAYR